MENVKTMHVKVSMDGEIRRFQCQTSFDVLNDTIRRLFLISDSSEELSLKYLDDENDYCIVSTQLELDYALSLQTDCIKLVVTKANSAGPTCRFEEHRRPCGNLENRLAWITSKLEQPNLPPRKVEKLTLRKQWIESQLANPGSRPSGWLGHRLAWINMKLEQDDLLPHKREKLLRRKAMIEARMAQGADQCPPGPPHHGPHHGGPHHGPHPGHGGHWRHHGHGGPHGRDLEARLAWVNIKLAQENLPPHKIEKFTARRDFLQTKLEEQKKATTEKATPESCQFPAPPHHGPHPGHGRFHPWGHHHGPHPGHGRHPWEHHGPHHHGGHAHHGHPWEHHGPRHGGEHGHHFPPPPPHHGSHHSGEHGHHFPPPPPHGHHFPAPPHHGPHHGGPHHGGPGRHGRGGFHLKSKLDWINFYLEQPGIPAQERERLMFRKQKIEAKLASKDI